MSEAANPDKVSAVARARFEEHVARLPYVSLAGALRPDTLEEAYAVQRSLLRMLEEDGRGPIAGYKIAITSKAIQELCGIDEPCGGAIFAPTVHASPAEVRLGDFVHLGLEFELAVRLADDMPLGPHPYTAGNVRPHIEACMPAFELIEDRNADYAALDGLSLVSDNCWCGGVVLGTASAGWRDLDMERTPVSLAYNDEPVERAVTGAAMGNPLASLAWVANLMAAQERPIRAGMIVITGSTLTTRFPKPGDAATYSVEGLGSVSVRVTA